MTRLSNHLKVFEKESALNQIRIWRNENLRLVFTNGCFDLIHAGHVYCLNEAKNLGDKLILGLNSDRSVAQLKTGGRPINTETDRALVLSSLSVVDMIVIFDELTPQHLIEEISPDVLVKGGDYQIEDIIGRDWVMAQGGEVVIIPTYKDYSTTALIRKLLN